MHPVEEPKRRLLRQELLVVDGEDKRQEAGQRPAIIGTPSEVADIVARYRDAGADELIVPDFTLGSMARKKDTCDLLMAEVAPAFR